MPTYEYRCGQCGAEYERRKHVSERATDECSRCAAAAVLMVSGFVYDARTTNVAWSDVAPLDADGHAMTQTETVRSGQFDRYDAMAPIKEGQRVAAASGHRSATAWEESKREVWRERKVVIR